MKSAFEFQHSMFRHRILMLVLGLIPYLFPTDVLAIDWALKYNELSRRVHERFPQPIPDISDAAPYVEWLGIKADDKKEIRLILEQATSLQNVDKDQQEIADWIMKFSGLLKLAQESGETTTKRGVENIVRKIETRGGWAQAVFDAQRLRPLYTKALETAFAHERVHNMAQCLIRFASRDIECSTTGLYGGCQGDGFQPFESKFYKTDVWNKNWDSGLDYECLSRNAPKSKGKVQLPADEGLKSAENVRAEALWWQFYPERQDVTQVMEDYYKDVLCQFPNDKGHLWYEELAKQYQLSAAQEYNRGFYGIIEGKTSVGKTKVMVSTPKDGQGWSAVSDENGSYSIKNVLLHKACSPFVIRTENCGFTDEEFEGPLEKPDPGHVFEKDLKTKPMVSGTLEVTLNPKYEHPFQGMGFARRVSYKYMIEDPKGAFLPFRLKPDETPNRCGVQSEGAARGSFRTHIVQVFSGPGPVVSETEDIATEAIESRIADGNVDYARNPNQTVYFRINLKVWTPSKKKCVKRPIQGCRDEEPEDEEEADWWPFHDFWAPLKDGYTEDVGIYRVTLHLEK